MSLRLLETVIPEEKVAMLKELISAYPTIGSWYDPHRHCLLGNTARLPGRGDNCGQEPPSMT